MSEKNIFDVDKRPVSSWKIAKELCGWFYLDLMPTDFDNEICMNIISQYHKNVKCLSKDKECLSQKQYATLYNIYTSFRVENVFKKFNEEYKWTCISLTKVELVNPIICCKSNKQLHIVYFEILEHGKYGAVAFEEEFSKYLNHQKYKKNKPEKEDSTTNLTTDDADFE
tara:strand:+ start:1410 stop:1916 length:507 start_codon:yes stop_codon:yes gene_type:complete